jgi:hypothetical protein
MEDLLEVKCTRTGSNESNDVVVVVVVVVAVKFGGKFVSRTTNLPQSEARALNHACQSFTEWGNRSKQSSLDLVAGI